MRSWCVVAVLTACGGKKAPEQFSVELQFDDTIKYLLDGSHFIVAGQDQVVAQGRVHYRFPSSTPKLTGTNGTLVYDSPCGEKRVEVPLEIPEQGDLEQRGRNRSLGTSYDLPLNLRLVDRKVAPAITRFYFFVGDAKSVAIGKRVISAPIPKFVDVTGSDCGPYDIKVDDKVLPATVATAPEMKAETIDYSLVRTTAMLVSIDPATCFQQRTYVYGESGSGEEVYPLTGSNLYKLAHSRFELELEAADDRVMSKDKSETLTAIVQGCQ